MRPILVAAITAMVLSLLLTPAVIRYFRRRGYGQWIREDGPQGHVIKTGTPTMGGVAIIVAGLAGYFTATLVFGPRYSPGGLLAIGTFALMGLVGFADDVIKLKRRRNLGLNKAAKFGGQALVAVIFATGATYVADTSTQLSFIGPLALDFGVFFVVWCFLILAASSNAVNLTDGLDGLAAGVAAMMLGAYVVIAFWVFRQGGRGIAGPITPESYSGVYTFEAWLHSHGLAVAAAAGLGACVGFLWWNAPPARVFMGDVGSLGMGGLLAALAVLTETELLLVILGALFVIETLSVIAQVASFRLTGRRLFKMTPLHHHFELQGWHEPTVIVRLWIIGGLATFFGLGVFYADFLARTAVTP